MSKKYLEIQEYHSSSSFHLELQVTKQLPPWRMEQANRLYGSVEWEGGFIHSFSFFLHPPIYIYIYHHHITSSAWISSNLSRYPTRSSIASDRSSGLHLVWAQSCCMQVRAGRPTFARPCEGVHRSTSLMSSSVHLRQCPACLVRLILIVFVMGRWWPYSCWFVGCCHQDLFNIACSILNTHTHIYIYICVFVCACVCACMCIIYIYEYTCIYI